MRRECKIIVLVLELKTPSGPLNPLQRNFFLGDNVYLVFFFSVSLLVIFTKKMSFSAKGTQG